MAGKVGINGYGRIGRNVLRAFFESGRDDIEIVAINDLGSAETNAHLTRYDTAHGKFPGSVEVDGDFLVVNGKRIKVLAERDPAKLPWGELGVEIVMECTGFFASKDKASAHLTGGAKKVIISAPAGKDLKTIVYGVNHDTLTAGAEMTPFLAPPVRCAEALSLLAKKPVHSSTTSTPRSPHGSLAGSRSASTLMRLPLTTRYSPSTDTSPGNLPWAVS